jgi:GNAT superfamily N-acetyltransferase
LKLIAERYKREVERNKIAIMTVQRLGHGDGRKLRALRLAALSDAPDAFGSSFAREVEYPPKRWEALAAQSASGERLVVFVAVDGARWLGMAGGHLREDDPSVADVWGTWVDASVRRHGLGHQLLEAIRGWASTRGVARLELSVTDRAPAAAALYRALGFLDTGEAHPLDSDPSITERSMTRSL